LRGRHQKEKRTERWFLEREMKDPLDLFSPEGGSYKNVFFLHPFFYYIYIPLSVQGFLLPFLPLLLAVSPKIVSFSCCRAKQEPPSRFLIACHTLMFNASCHQPLSVRCVSATHSSLCWVNTYDRTVEDSFSSILTSSGIESGLAVLNIGASVCNVVM
jgi:hypothetical protein